MSIQIGTVEKCEQFVRETGPFDMILIDHDKAAYLSDFKLLDKFGAIQKGTLVIGDNIVFPGAPDYLKYFQG